MNKKEANLLKDLKLAVESPKRYLVTYFDEMKNQIDLECQMYLDRAGLADEDKEKAITQQLEFIQEVDSFEKKCLANVGQFELPTKEQIDGIIEEKDLYIALFKVQKQLFMNQSMVFFSEKLFDIFFRHNLRGFSVKNDCKEHYSFGVLFFIADEFMELNEKFVEMYR